MDIFSLILWYLKQFILYLSYLTLFHVNQNGQNSKNDLNVYNYFNRVYNFNGKYPFYDKIDFLKNHLNGEFCYRKCEIGEKRKICYFKFTLEYYHAMGPACKNCGQGVLDDCYNSQCITADGLERGVMSINRQIPGPSIQVCKNDVIVVDVINKMDGSSEAIHWHGINQHETPYMDGVPFLTQCPIDYSTTFRYSFSAFKAGTHFYHSHSGLHRANGIYGALIVREPEIYNPYYTMYDYDDKPFTIIISDWSNSLAEMKYPGVPHRYSIKPTSILINGKGKKFNKTSGKYTSSPFEKFIVERNRRYKFRFINSASYSCNFRFQIENHTLLFIASDSNYVQPLEVDTLFSTSGERYDFILFTNNRPRDYWIRVRPVGSCAVKNLEQFAILKYSTKDNHQKSREEFDRKIPKYNEEFISKSQLNHPNASCSSINTKDYCITHLQSYKTDDTLYNAVPDFRFYLGFLMKEIPFDLIFNERKPFSGFLTVNSKLFVAGTINGINLVFPSYPFLTQPEQISETLFCDANNRPLHCKHPKVLCQCIHRLKVQLNSVVELIIVDETAEIDGMNHPFHLHGYEFMVTDIGQNLSKISKHDDRKLQTFSHSPNYNNRSPPFKDTISIPSKGYTIVKFRANNLEFWLLHCHFEWHFITGMGVIIQVGEINEMIKPPRNFPKCGNFKPNINNKLN